MQHEGVGPQGGFSYFVFQQLYDMKQFSKLLRLGEEFQDELLIFLKRHSDLLWLHQVFLHQFSSASETLHSLALAQDEESMTATNERTVSESEDVQPTFADRKRFLNLSKIAYVAGIIVYFPWCYLTYFFLLLMMNITFQTRILIQNRL